MPQMNILNYSWSYKQLDVSMVFSWVYISPIWLEQVQWVSVCHCYKLHLFSSWLILQLSCVQSIPLAGQFSDFSRAHWIPCSLGFYLNSPFNNISSKRWSQVTFEWTSPYPLVDPTTWRYRWQLVQTISKNKWSPLHIFLGIDNHICAVRLCWPGALIFWFMHEMKHGPQNKYEAWEFMQCNIALFVHSPRCYTRCQLIPQWFILFILLIVKLEFGSENETLQLPSLMGNLWFLFFFPEQLHFLAVLQWNLWGLDSIHWTLFKE